MTGPRHAPQPANPLSSPRLPVILPRRPFLIVVASVIVGFLARAADPSQWLSYPGVKGPGKGRRIVLIAADQEYRSEHSMPMLARILSTHHGFDCTVLFGVNEKGEVDPTLPVYPEKGRPLREHHIPGLEHLATADLVIFFPRLLTLPMAEREQIVRYIDSGRPIMSIRTGNHGFLAPLPYRVRGKAVRWGEDVLGGSFMEHHGQWQADSTRGIIVAEQRGHPILAGVEDIWGQSDVYRTYAKGSTLPAGCTALVWGQPLLGRKHDDPPNPNLEPLPVAWFKHWETSEGKQARVFHSTMGSAHDFQSAGLRRLIIQAAYWLMSMESQIDPARSVDIVGPYAPPKSGFNYKELGIKPRPVAEFR